VSQLAGAHAVGVDVRHRTEEALDQLLLAHLQGKDRRGGRLARVQGGMLDNVQAKSGLAHRRPPGDDDQVARLQAGGQVVKIGKAGRHPGNGLLTVIEALDGMDSVLDDLAGGIEGRAGLHGGDAEDRLLRPVEDALHLPPS